MWGYVPHLAEIAIILDLPYLALWNCSIRQLSFNYHHHHHRYYYDVERWGVSAESEEGRGVGGGNKNRYGLTKGRPTCPIGRNGHPTRLQRGVVV